MGHSVYTLRIALSYYIHRLKIAPKRTMLPSSALLSTVGIMAAVKHYPSNKT